MADNTPDKATGRPSSYSDEVAERICERLEEGESLRAICADDNMPDKSTVLRWLRKNEDFRTQYASARATQADEFLEEITEIANDTSGDVSIGKNGFEPNPVAVTRAKLKIDTLKWRMSKQNPKKYGDKLDVTSGGEKVAPQFYILPDGTRIEF